MILVDSSVLIAAALPRDASHERAAAALRSCEGERLGVPVTILAETMAFLGRRVGVDGQRAFWDGFMDSAVELLPVEDSLVADARDIDRRYEDADYGFADCTLLASCEAQRCARVLTLDARLGAYRPSFAEALEILL